MVVPSASQAYVRMLFDREPWAHQVAGVSQVVDKLESGCQSVALTSPTGGGKSLQIVALIRWAVDRGKRVALYSNRNMLIEQTVGILQSHHINFGVRGAKFPEHRRLDAPVQMCSIQTEISQSIRKQYRDLHPADVVIVDEAHIIKAGGSLAVLNRHLSDGAALVGVTATPLGISKIYQSLVVAGKTSELIRCGALVPALVYAPDEMDLSRIKPTQTGEYSLGDIRREVWSHAIIDRVYERWQIVNPDARHTLAFGPGVEESVWLASEFDKRGVPAAHIDSDDVWVGGKSYDSDRAARQDVMARWNAGEIKVLCNRFVLREGVDLPSCYNLILATPIGSLTSYIQIVGRALRRSPLTPDHVVISDHGGSTWRMGSPNEDRDWESLYFMDEAEIVRQRIERMREQNEEYPEPIVCPNCGLQRSAGKHCPQPPIGCGFSHKKNVRLILQKDGTLRKVEGNMLHKRRRKLKHNTQRLWDGLYFPSAKSKSKQASTFLQIEARFYWKYGYYPPRDLNNMPRYESDWSKKAREVPRSDLIRKSQDG